MSLYKNNKVNLNSSAEIYLEGRDERPEAARHIKVSHLSLSLSLSLVLSLSLPSLHHCVGADGSYGNASLSEPDPVSPSFQSDAISLIMNTFGHGLAEFARHLLDLNIL